MTENSTETKEDLYFGPVLPPKLITATSNNNSKIIGPALPSHLKILQNEAKSNDNSDSEPEFDMIGPLPAEECLNKELEERAIQIKLNLLNKADQKPISREEWMVELPDVKSISQIVGQRKFRNKEMPDMSDRSMWTDTPEQKDKKKCTDVNNKSQIHTKVLQEKDLIQEKIVEKHKKNKRNKSLIDLHEETRKKVKVTSAINERRPFDREIDLKSTKLSSSQTKEIINKAKVLDSRFASGQSKFL